MKLPDDSPKIFKKSNIDCYMERLSTTFCNRKYSILDEFCCAKEELKQGKNSEYQPDGLGDNLIDNIKSKHQGYSYPSQN